MERTFTIGKSLICSATASALLTISGCGTSLVGGSYDYANNSKSSLEGIPFTLNKPVPVVTHTIAADSGKETYQVGFNWVADSSQRYTLQIKPSMLASVDFTMTFDAGGSLTETSAKSTDQSGALLATIGKLALLTVADTAKEAPQTYANLLNFGDDYAARTNSVGVWRSIRIKFVELKNATRIQSDYVYEDSVQLDFLRGLLADLRKYAVAAKDGDLQVPENPAAKDFFGVLDQFKKDFPGEKNAVLPDDVEKAFRAGDIKTLKDKKSEQVAALETRRVVYASSRTGSAKDEVDASLAKVKLVNVAIKSTRPEIVLLAHLAEMPLADWQKRVVAPVIKDIAEKQQQLRVAEASNQPLQTQAQRRADLERAVRKKASILGVLTEYDRREALTRRLERETTAKDLKAIREERDALDVTIAAAEPAKQKAKAAVADEPSNAIYMHSNPDPKPLSSKNVTDRLNGEFLGVRPRYVIVVRNAQPEAGAVPPPVAASAPAEGPLVILDPAPVGAVDVVPALAPSIAPPQEKPSAGKVGDLKSPTAPPVPTKKPESTNTKKD